ncbi:MAG: radical SAM family heme chaperone HemW [Lachnospiraceae bacterium]|mgnify:FL=1|nr:radical SAM family heme chaperone HemW [Lachnospiraceae bacterium]
MKMEPEIRDLSLYVHIPFCKSKCLYCDFLSFSGYGYDRQKQYVSALCKEIEAYSSIAGEYVLQTVFIGGGTPSYMDVSLIEQIIQTIDKVFVIDKRAEITIEGNPDSLTREKLEEYRRLGINRLSIGLQSTNDDMLKILGRVHNYDQFIAAYNSARQAGFNNINVDLMSGLPKENVESYIHTLAKVVKMQPEHISAYSLIIEEGTPFSVDEELLKELPSEEVDRLLYARTKTLLQNSGYSRYEISNYARTGFECRHNIVYWTGGEYLGVGLGASSYLNVRFPDNRYQKVRFHGVENLAEYIGRFSQCGSMQEDEYTEMFRMFGKAEEDIYEEDIYGANILSEFIRDYYKDLHILKRKENMEEFMFLGFRMLKGISKTEFKERFGVAAESVYGKVIDKYIDMGMIIEQEDRIYLSDAGIDVSNVIMAEFML